MLHCAGERVDLRLSSQAPVPSFQCPAKMTEMRIYLFANQALVNRAQIQQQLVESRGNPFLSLLLQRCSDALRHEISQLSPLERTSIPAFNTIDELNDRASNSDAHEGVQNALLLISQLAQYTQ